MHFSTLCVHASPLQGGPTSSADHGSAAAGAKRAAEGEAGGGGRVRRQCRGCERAAVLRVASANVGLLVWRVRAVKGGLAWLLQLVTSCPHLGQQKLASGLPFVCRAAGAGAAGGAAAASPPAAPSRAAGGAARAAGAAAGRWMWIARGRRRRWRWCRWVEAPVALAALRCRELPVRPLRCFT